MMSARNLLKAMLLAIMPFMLLGCEPKVDCNGDLDGQWQMTEWISPEGDLIGGNELEIYYSFQLQMMMFQKLSESSGQQRTLFENMGSSIRVYDPFEYAGNGHDRILPMDVLQRYGVPGDGIMKIEHLSPGKLVLYSVERGQLTFRKY